MLKNGGNQCLLKSLRTKRMVPGSFFDFNFSLSFFSFFFQIFKPFFSLSSAFSISTLTNNIERFLRVIIDIILEDSMSFSCYQS